MKYMLIICLLLIGCGGVVNYAEQNIDEQQKNFANPVYGYSGIYIFRDKFLGHKLNTEIFIDGKIIGKNLGYTYLYIEVPEGRHVITSHFVGYASLELETKQGKLYFISDELDTGMFETKSHLYLIAEHEGKPRVLNCKLAQGVMQY